MNDVEWNKYVQQTAIYLASAIGVVGNDKETSATNRLLMEKAGTVAFQLCMEATKRFAASSLLSKEQAMQAASDAYDLSTLATQPPSPREE